MRRLFNYLFGNTSAMPYAPDWAGMLKEKETTIAISPHKLIRIENVKCRREEDGIHMEFYLRNLGDEIGCYGIKLINNFDPQGHEYEYCVSFGKGKTTNGQMLHYTLPHDIPIRVTVKFFGVESAVDSFAQVKLIGLCVRKPRTRGYNPTGNFLFRNVSIAD